MIRRSFKLFIGILTILLIAVGLWIASGFFGNPVSKMKAKSTAEKYIKEIYDEEDLLIEDVFYNFKTGYYDAEIKSKSSIDTHFTLSITANKVKLDSYEEDVLSGWNTYMRLEHDYNEMVKGVFSSDKFPLKSDIDFGTIELFHEENIDHYDEPDYGLVQDELVLDKEYDVKEIAKSAGHIIYYAQDEDVSFEKASDLLMVLKKELDDAEIPFYAIDFNLEKPRQDDGRRVDDSAIYTAHFLYEDIYEEGLVERLKKANKDLMDYYDELDKDMK